MVRLLPFDDLSLKKTHFLNSGAGRSNPPMRRSIRSRPALVNPFLARPAAGLVDVDDFGGLVSVRGDFDGLTSDKFVERPPDPQTCCC